MANKPGPGAVWPRQDRMRLMGLISAAVGINIRRVSSKSLVSHSKVQACHGSSVFNEADGLHAFQGQALVYVLYMLS